MPRFHSRSVFRHLALLVAVLFFVVHNVVGVLSVAPVLAAEGGSKSAAKPKKRPRYEAGMIGGTIIQLETMWIPVMVSGNRHQYVGMTVHLLPNPDKMAEACYITPWVTQALVVYFNTYGLSLADRNKLDSKAYAKVLAAVVDKVAKPGIFQGVELIDAPPGKLDLPDTELSMTCV